MNSPFIFQSDSDDVRRLWVDVARRADAMGVMGFDEAATIDAGAADRLVTRVREAGVASVPRLTWSHLAPPTSRDVADLLRLVIAALDGSPIPKSEWPSLARVFDTDQLASLVGVSLSSLRRYQSGDRETPDGVAERLHYLALVVADLAGSYNAIGIRRWFERSRTALGGRSPAALLKREWDPEGPGATKVRDLARSLVAFSST